MFGFFYVLKVLGYFRVNAADEAAGLDASHHGGSAYPVELDDDTFFHKGSNYNGNQSGYNKVVSHFYLVQPDNVPISAIAYCSTA